MGQGLEGLGEVALTFVAHLGPDLSDAPVALPQQIHGAAEAELLHIGPDGLAVHRLEDSLEGGGVDEIFPGQLLNGVPLPQVGGQQRVDLLDDLHLFGVVLSQLRLPFRDQLLQKEQQLQGLEPVIGEAQPLRSGVEGVKDVGDLRGGGTLGSISTSQVSIASVDIGLPQLAMHSCNETAGVEDSAAMIRVIKQFYSTHRCMPEEGVLIQQAD